jgi:hypothetical protein
LRSRGIVRDSGLGVARVVDEDVKSAEPRDGGLRVLRFGDVERDCQQVFVLATRRGDPRCIAAGGDHGVAGSQSGRGGRHPSLGRRR